MDLVLIALLQVVSPGELAKPHAQLEGIRNCTKCHKAGSQLAADKCLACHVELKARIEHGQGFHGRMNEPDRSTCQSCHKEHQGRSFALVDWGGGGMDRFAHVRTGFPLKGKHAQAKCAACHKTAPKTFLGAQTACVGCHADEHRGQLGPKCESCHNESAWKPAPAFDHDKTNYALRGQHARVACAKCHPKETDARGGFLKFAQLPHSRCTDCHSDPHQGKFGPGCESCHSVDGWRTIAGGAKNASFHEKTRYPLRGAHVSVSCRACHGPFPGQRAKFKGLAFGHCTDCHNDAHMGQLARKDCERCHSVDGFVPARFENEQHKETRFALEGAHQAVGCIRCHPRDANPPPAPKARRARPVRPERFSLAVFKQPSKGEKCESCHSDPHGGQFRDRACAACHRTSSFRDVDFDHGKTRFPLAGQHAKTACASCHKTAQGVVRYKGLRVACDGCHADVHVGQLAGDCARCHGTDDFKRTAFNHNDPRFTAFALEGKHAELACAKCHPTVVAAGVKTRRYKPLPTECEDCHTDVHHGAFRGFEP